MLFGNGFYGGSGNDVTDYKTLGLLGMLGQSQKQGQPNAQAQSDGAAGQPREWSGGLFGGHWKTPMEQSNEVYQGRMNALDALKADPRSAALFMGLSMLANMGSNPGQNLGRSALGALNALGEAAQEDEQNRFKRDYLKNQDDRWNKQFGLQQDEFTAGRQDAAQKMALEQARFAQTQQQAAAQLGLEQQRLGLEQQRMFVPNWQAVPDLGIVYDPRTGNTKNMDLPEGMGPTTPKIDQKYLDQDAKNFADLYNNINQGAMDATTALDNISSARKSLSSGIYTGFGGDLVQTGRRMLAPLGIGSPNTVAEGDNLRRLTNEFALMMRSPNLGMGMPGAVSDKDIEFLKQAQIGLDKNPQANKVFLDAMEKITRRKMDIAKLAQAYVQQNGRLDNNFYGQISDMARSNPLFSNTNSSPALPPGFTEITAGGSGF